jgi:hypothetical protein
VTTLFFALAVNADARLEKAATAAAVLVIVDDARISIEITITIWV